MFIVKKDWFTIVFTKAQLTSGDETQYSKFEGGQLAKAGVSCSFAMGKYLGNFTNM